MKNTKDEQLVKKYLEGDSQAFEELLERYLKPIYNFLLRLTGDLPSAEDLAQETFFKAWNNLRRFDQTKNFKVWLFSIARNTAYDFFKKKKSLPFAYFENGEGKNQFDEIIDEKAWPDEILANKNSGKELEKKLKKIPKNYRVILLLHYKDGFSFHEIAQILKKPYNTIKSQHQRGLRYAKKFLRTI